MKTRTLNDRGIGTSVDLKKFFNRSLTLSIFLAFSLGVALPARAADNLLGRDFFQLGIGNKNGVLRAKDNGDGSWLLYVVAVNADGTPIAGGGGGGGAVTIADGASVTLGAKADTAASSDTGTFTQIALTKRQLQTLATIATNTGAATPAGANVIGKVGIDQTTPGTTNLVALGANQSVNQTQMGGVTIASGNGVSGTGVQRFTLASDSTGQVTLATGANTIGALTANQSVNAAQINGVAPLMGNGVTGTGSQRVTIASDNTAFSVAAAQSGTWTVQPGNTANTTAWKVDGSAVTQPVSGTVTANAGTNLNTSALALDATVGLAQGSTTSGQKGPLMQAAVTTAPPTYTTAQTSPLSLTTGGALRYDLASVGGTGISTGTGASGAGIQRVTVANDSNILATQSGTWTVQPGNTANTTAWLMAGGKTNNNAAPGATNLGSLEYLANAAPPSWTEGNLVLGSVDLSGNQRSNISLINGVAPLMGNGSTGTGSQRVTIASDNTAFSVNASQSGTWTMQPGNTANTTAWLMTGGKTNNSAAPGATNLGSVGFLANAAAPSWTEGNLVLGSVDLSGNQRSNISLINGVAPLMGNGVTGTGSQRITLSSDNTGIAKWGHALVGTAAPAGATYPGLIATTANPTNATAGNLVGAMADKAGRLVTTPTAVRELVVIQQTNIATTSETAITAAAIASTFYDITDLVITTAGAAAQTITIKDSTAGTTRMVLNYPNAAVAPGQPLVLHFSPPLPQATANNVWTITNSAATAINVTAVYVKNL